MIALFLKHTPISSKQNIKKKTKQKQTLQMRILNLKYTLGSLSWLCFLEHFDVHTSNASSFIWQLTSYQVSSFSLFGGKDYLHKNFSIPE